MFEVGRLRTRESNRHHFHIRFRHSYKLNIALFPIFVNNMIVRLFNLIFLYCIDFVLIFLLYIDRSAMYNCPFKSCNRQSSCAVLKSETKSLSCA